MFAKRARTRLEIATIDGSPLTPDAGGQLLLIKATYSNSRTHADRSCGNTDLYIQVFDTQERDGAGIREPSGARKPRLQ